MDPKLYELHRLVIEWLPRDSRGRNECLRLIRELTAQHSKRLQEEVRKYGT